MPTLPRKQSVNVSIDSALLREARAMRLNLSKTLEERLAELVRHTEREQWLKKNREALEDYNQRIEQAGVFSDGLRRC
ncbi:MAG TPA: type II toxin-antitoxin system CcdA family antitoxin [Acidiferrobacterales bacterium]|nr:type II toxin-antitoxin system CcdA family antitoxin [Acidiferrobacterales bacterium]